MRVLAVLTTLSVAASFTVVFADPLPPLPAGSPPAAGVERQTPKPPVADPKAAGAHAMGVRSEDVPELVALHLPLVFGKHRGVLLTMVDRGGPGDRAGLVPGDILLRFNSHSLDSPNDLTRLMDQNGPALVDLVVLHGGILERVTVRPERIAAPPAEGGGKAAAANATSGTATAAGANSAASINVATPSGTVALTGADGRFQLRAEFADPQGRPVRIDRRGTLEALQPDLDQLPNDLRTLVLRRLTPAR